MRRTETTHSALQMTIISLSRDSITTTVPSILIKIPLQITPRIIASKISVRVKKKSRGANLLSYRLVKASRNSHSPSCNNIKHHRMLPLCLRHQLFRLILVLLKDSNSTKEIKANRSKTICRII